MTNMKSPGCVHKPYFGRYQTRAIPADQADEIHRRMIDELRKATSLQPDPELVEMLAFLLRNDADPGLVIYAVR